MSARIVFVLVVLVVVKIVVGIVVIRPIAVAVCVCVVPAGVPLIHADAQLCPQPVKVSAAPAVLQLACHLHLLGLGSAAPHWLDPLERTEPARFLVITFDAYSIIDPTVCRISCTSDSPLRLHRMARSMASAFVHRQPYLFWAARASGGTPQMRQTSGQIRAA